MSLALAPTLVKHPEWSALPDQYDFEDSSPFGIQGLARGSIQILKPECVNRLAVKLALRATAAQIKDDEYVARTLSYHPDWFEEYQVIHLIERSLWIQGHRDLVMTMTRNPSQIPDNPPEKILTALSAAYQHHPDANVWYGVPMFGEQKKEEGLPIPVTADEVRQEAKRRIDAAREHALRWQWFYQSALYTMQIPTKCQHYGTLAANRIRASVQHVADYWKKSRQDAKRRVRAMCMAELERCRMGRAVTVVPEHRTRLGRALETSALLLELILFQVKVVGAVTPVYGILSAPLMIAPYIPALFVPALIIPLDPFLFVELKEEPGRLRHIGHWYWQKQDNGQDKLHLHV